MKYFPRDDSAATSTVVENARACACCCEDASGSLFDRLRSVRSPAPLALALALAPVRAAAAAATADGRLSRSDAPGAPLPIRSFDGFDLAEYVDLVGVGGCGCGCPRRPPRVALWLRRPELRPELLRDRGSSGGPALGLANGRTDVGEEGVGIVSADSVR